MLNTETRSGLPSADAIAKATESAVRAIPPLWPLSSSVAVNPFLGQTGEPLAVTAARLQRVAGAGITMPRSWYRERLAAGAIADKDLDAALQAAPEALRPQSLVALKQAIERDRPRPQALPTIADLAGKVTAIDWPGLVNDRIGHWAAGYFDQGQALWAYPITSDAYTAWRAFATHDLTPEIAGLSGFGQAISTLPQSAETAIAEHVENLSLGEAALETYFHRLLTSLGGWAQVARYRLWQAELEGKTDTALTDLLAIHLAFETALFREYGSLMRAEWQEAIVAYAKPVAASSDDVIDAIFQEAVERAAQRQIDMVLATTAHPRAPNRPALQVAFCIDVRSEVFRRALESLDPAISTLGFAGFFGMGIAHRRFASDVVEARLPVLLKPGLFTCTGEAAPEIERADHTARIKARAKRAWGRFKLAAISSFAFVEATGPVYVVKLLRDGLGLAGHSAPNDPPPRFSNAIDRDARIAMATNVLKAMSLTEGFAPLVLLAGHGANVVNNPHASALHCGACGGYSGETNARLVASLLNDPEVRSGLAARGIQIPADTLFLGALHDTTTDEVTIYEGDYSAAAHASDLDRARQWLKEAGALARSERALRLPSAKRASDVVQRARDWAQLRPEWALAGCQAFIAAPRLRTRGSDLKGRAFLHDYDWQRDEGFGVLELILTAPVVVASWISLQYYGSTVAPDVFGGGNKLLHNVTGGFGVVEGNGGVLRGGLPWQSVHDGERLIHEPLRLSVLIEAPREAITNVLQRHPGVRALFDNRWMHLFALDDEGRMSWRYAGNLEWEKVTRDIIAHKKGAELSA
ncbi:YbcC family protein [Oryzifoliimicrobium ureilyticus]|uniref:YbcC family protein n=1 Tax=Oryzifoliimicrobium ureilyticus TaxID=3113724 RepID=UPI003076644C